MNATSWPRCTGCRRTGWAAKRATVCHYSTQEQSTLQMIEALRPWLVRLEHAFFALLPANRYVRFDSDALLKTDLKTRTEIYGLQRTIGPADHRRDARPGGPGAAARHGRRGDHPAGRHGGDVPAASAASRTRCCPAHPGDGPGRGPAGEAAGRGPGQAGPPGRPVPFPRSRCWADRRPQRDPAGAGAGGRGLSWTSWPPTRTASARWRRGPPGGRRTEPEYVGPWIPRTPASRASTATGGTDMPPAKKTPAKGGKKPAPNTKAPAGSYALPGGGPGGADAYPVKHPGAGAKTRCPG